MSIKRPHTPIPVADLCAYWDTVASVVWDDLGNKASVVYLSNGIRLEGHCIACDVAGIQMARDGRVLTILWQVIATYGLADDMPDHVHR